MSKPQYLYLYHFADALHHARHYLGSTTNVPQRQKRHAAGQGAKITAHVAKHGGWKVAAVFALKDHCPLTLREVERLAKSRHNGSAFCPICNEEPEVPRWCLRIPDPCQAQRSIQCPNSDDLTDHIQSTMTPSVGLRPRKTESTPSATSSPESPTSTYFTTEAEPTPF